VLGDEPRLGLLEEAVSVLEESVSRLELAHALADLGRELNRLGRRRDGRDAERRAIGLAQECGASALAEQAMVELHAGPGRRARAELTGRNALTAAECREIAQALFVTEKTVERHLSSAYHKLEIRSRFQLSSSLKP
jgi:ATP/maltotriose-dependent transcriptional regulator MalT